MLKKQKYPLKKSIELVSYWQQQLSGSPPLLDLPTDKPRQSSVTFKTEIQSISLPRKLVNSLQRISQDRGVEIFTLLLAVFKILIYRYSDRHDILIGSPIVSQNEATVDRSSGFYFDNIVLRTDLSGNPTFLEILQRIKKVVAEAREHQDLSFDRLVEALEIERSPSYHPLFQVMFSLEQSKVDLAIVPVSSEPVNTTQNLDSDQSVAIDLPDRQSSSLDLALRLAETAAGISGHFEYSTDLFAVATIERMVLHFQTLLESVVANPEQLIDELQILTASERQQLLVEWNQTQTDYPNLCIHQLFEAQVERTPDNIAVIFEDRQLTYRELNNRANQLAHYLRARGVGSGVLVGLYLERSLEMVVGLWGILKSGGAYVPLDPAYPKDRVAYILADADAKVLIADAQLLASLPPHPAEVVCFDTHQAEIDRQPLSNPVTATQPDNLAYIIYTSGSTGNPKGVEVCHSSQANLLNYLQHSPGLTNADTLLAVTTICFDTSTADMFLPLIVGAKIVLVSSEIAADGFQLLAKLTDSGATFMQATPVSFRLLLAAGWQGSPNLRVVSTGEALSRNLANLLLDKVAELWDLYGPTETTVWSTGSKINDLRRNCDFQGALELIGRPIANTQAYILDRCLQPVPIGIRGELHIGGDCLAKGYLHRPDLTSEKFIANPFSDDPHARLYKTGDLARYLPDGNIEYIGRIDNQVKIRGFRIELGEIEGLLAKHPAVKEVAVIVREDLPGDSRLAAYITIDSLSERLRQDDRSPTITDLREFLASKLPSYMIPAAFVCLDALPLTPNGKIDRRALPVPSYTRQLEGEFVASQDEVELQLTKIWKQVLGIDRIGIEDNFFELGGYSLLAVRAISEIEKLGYQRLPLSTFLAAPTIKEFANLIRIKKAVTTWPSLVPIESRGSKPPLFCMHPVGGNILEYYPLAHHLGPEQPIHGLQSTGLDGVQVPLSRIEDMAARYIQEIQSLQPHGPYFLTGYSFGALVAFEVACQLESQGEKIGLLALLDHKSPNLQEVSTAFFTSLGIHFRNLQKLELKEQVDYIKYRILFWTTYRNSKNKEQELLLDSWNEPLPPEYLQVLEANFQARKDYIGKFYPGKVTLFRSSVQFATQALYPDLGWGELAGDVETIDLPGHHNNLLKEPYIKNLARELKLRLERSNSKFSF
jgi:amino acid adenylation domain-containing protein